MKIDSVVVLCWAGDFRLARICLASVRYFYPRLPLYLMKDITKGDFDTSELEENLSVSTKGLSGAYGKFFGKIELLFLPELGRFLFIDADQIMTGPVVDALERVEAEFVVEPDNHAHPASDVVDRLYYNRRLLGQWNPGYEMPPYHFNSGQWVARAGVLSRDDFNDIVDWNPRLTIRDPGIFCMTDQSILNYCFFRLARAGRITLQSAHFMLLVRTEDCRRAALDEIAARRAPPLLFHWAGEHKSFVGLMKRSDLLRFFEQWYYRRLKHGTRLRWSRRLASAPANAYAFAYWTAGRAKRRLRASLTRLTT